VLELLLAIGVHPAQADPLCRSVICSYIYTPSKAATIKNKENKEKEAK